MARKEVVTWFFVLIVIVALMGKGVCAIVSDSFRKETLGSVAVFEGVYPSGEKLDGRTFSVFVGERGSGAYDVNLWDRASKLSMMVKVDMHGKPSMGKKEDDSGRPREITIKEIPGRLK